MKSNNQPDLRYVKSRIDEGKASILDQGDPNSLMAVTQRAWKPRSKASPLGRNECQEGSLGRCTRAHRGRTEPKE